MAADPALSWEGARVAPAPKLLVVSPPTQKGEAQSSSAVRVLQQSTFALRCKLDPNVLQIIKIFRYPVSVPRVSKMPFLARQTHSAWLERSNALPANHSYAGIGDSKTILFVEPPAVNLSRHV